MQANKNLHLIDAQEELMSVFTLVVKTTSSFVKLSSQENQAKKGDFLSFLRSKLLIFTTVASTEQCLENQRHTNLSSSLDALATRME